MFRQYLAVLTALLALISCRKETEGGASGGDCIVRFSTSGSIDVAPRLTKAAVPLPQGVTVCVAAYGRAEGAAANDPKLDVWKAANTYAVQAGGSLAASLTDAGGNPVAGSASDMALGGGTYDFYAYSPALETEPDRYTVKGATHYMDFMGAVVPARAVSRSAPNVELKFEHKCSKVRFNVATAAGMSNHSLEADSAVLYKMAVSPAQDFTLGGDLLPTIGGVGDKCLLKQVDAAADNKSTSVWDIVLPKSNGAFDGDFHLKINGTRYVLKAKAIPAMSLSKGIQHIFSAVVRQGSVDLVLNVASWNAVSADVDAGEGGGAGSGSWGDGNGEAGGDVGQNHGIVIGRWENVDWSGSVGSNFDPVTGAVEVGSWRPVAVIVDAGGTQVADIDSWVKKELAAQAGASNGGSVEDWGNNDFQTGLGPQPPVVTPANCFMVEPGKSVSFDARVIGNATTASISPQSVQVLWQDIGVPTPLIAEVSLEEDGFTTVRTSNQAGNAVVAAYSGPDGTGEILWSWHIWVTDYRPDVVEALSRRPANTAYPVPGGEVHVYGDYYLLLYKQGSLVTMDRNLGAAKTYNDGAPAAGDNTAEQAFGLLYQWGRKDPFPRADGSTFDAVTSEAKAIPIYGPTGVKLDDEVTDAPGSGIRNVEFATIVSPPLTNTKAYSIANPLAFIYAPAWPNDWYGGDMKQDHYRWGMGRVKTLNDPCPAGWRVHVKDTWYNFNATVFKYYTDGTAVSRTAGIPYRLTNGALYQPGSDPLAWYPASGFKNGQTLKLSNVGNTGSTWSNYATGANGGNMSSSTTGLNVDSNQPRSHAYSVRCVQE